MQRHSPLVVIMMTTITLTACGEDTAPLQNPDATSLDDARPSADATPQSDADAPDAAVAEMDAANPDPLDVPDMGAAPDAEPLPDAEPDDSGNEADAEESDAGDFPDVDPLPDANLDSGIEADGGSPASDADSIEVRALASPINPGSRLYSDNTYRRMVGFEVSTNAPAEIEEVTIALRATDPAQSSIQDYTMVYLADNAASTIGNGFVTSTTTPTIITLSPRRTIPAGSSMFFVDADLATICGACTVSIGGHHLGFDIIDLQARWSATGSPASVSVSSTDPPHGNTHYLFRGVPIFAELTLPSTTLTDGTIDGKRFSVGASDGTIDVAKMAFRVTPIGVTLQRVSVYDVTMPMNEELLFDQAVNITAESRIDSPFIAPLMISDGQYYTFAVRYEISGGVQSGDALQTCVLGDSALPDQGSRPNFPGTLIDIQMDVNNAFIWSDRSAPGHSEMTGDWTNGFAVAGLPDTYGWCSTLTL